MAAKARLAQPPAAQQAAVLPVAADNEVNEPQPSPQGVEPEVRGSPLAPQPSPQGEGSPLDDDDEPVWRMESLKSGPLKSGALKNGAQNNAPTANESANAESPVDRVLRIIPGTVLN